MGAAVDWKNRPLTTAFEPPVVVTLILTCPLMSQTRYCPLVNALTLRLSNKAPVTASTMSSLCARCSLFQSRQYSASLWATLSVKFRSIVKLKLYQVAAMRSLLFAFCNARTSLVEAAHVYGY